MATYDDSGTVEGVQSPNDAFLGEFASFVDADTVAGGGTPAATIHSLANGVLLFISLPPALPDE